MHIKACRSKQRRTLLLTPPKNTQISENQQYAPSKDATLHNTQNPIKNAKRAKKEDFAKWVLKEVMKSEIKKRQITRDTGAKT